MAHELRGENAPCAETEGGPDPIDSIRAPRALCDSSSPVGVSKEVVRIHIHHHKHILGERQPVQRLTEGATELQDSLSTE